MKNVYALAIVLVQALSFGLTSTASAADPGIFDKKGNVLQDSMASDPTQPNWKMATEADNLDIHGVGWLSGRCSGTLIDMGGSDETPVYVLTAAHCVSKMENGRTRVDEKVKEVFVVRKFFDQKGDIGGIPISRLAYASLEGADVALYETPMTRGDAKSLGITLLKVSPQPPQIGDAVEMVGIPLEDMNEDQMYLHRGNCNVVSRNYSMIPSISTQKFGWLDGLDRLNGLTGYEAPPSTPSVSLVSGTNCSVVPGVSGGPLLNSKDESIVGVWSTTFKTRESLKVFSMPKATAEDQNFLITRFGLTSDASDVSKVPGCFDTDGNFDLNLETCHLSRKCSPDSNGYQKDKLSCAKERCDSGDSFACAQIFNENDSEDVLNSNLSYFKKGCDWKDALSCEALGRTLLNSKEKKIQREGADALVEGCGLGEAQSCYGVGMMVLDPKVSASMLSRACEGHVTQACEVLAPRLLKLGDGYTWLSAILRSCYFSENEEQADHACATYGRKAMNKEFDASSTLIETVLGQGCTTVPNGASCKLLKKLSAAK